MGLLTTDGQRVIRTKAVRRIGEEWDATLVLGVEITPSQVLGYRQMKRKQKVIPLDAPIPQAIDEETEAVRHYESEGYSASEPANDCGEGQQAVQEGTQTWEEAGLENPMNPASASSANMEFEQGGGVPVTPLDMASDDDDAETPTSSTKHPASTPLVGERGKVQKMDDDPTPVPKIKAARTGTGVNQVAEVELCHNDEDMFPEGWEDNAAILDSEDEYIAEQGEGQGPPNVSDDKLQQRNERAALDEVGKLFQMDVIQPVVLSETEGSTENVVDTTLV